ncbi:MAG: hypothetical protein L0Z62_33175 [Gemmataceae bacterium]|nr:hypothetical protein [Gemmataceae bacterium]
MTTTAPPIDPALESLRDSWLSRWPDALAAWSKFTKLSEPRWCLTPEDEKEHQLADSFAMIRLTDQAVVVSLTRVQSFHVEDFAVEVLAHEIGHHVYCPGSLLEHGRMLARIRRGLPTKEHRAPLIANLYADLLINDRLQRDSGLNMAGVYQALVKGSADRLWTLYMRIYEILWGLKKGSLATGPIDKLIEGDAQLGARVVRSYARDWLDGAGKFAALCLPYLLEDDGQGMRELLKGWLDTESAGH